MSRGSGVGASHLKIHPAVKVIMPSAGLAAGHVTGPANGAPGWMAQCWACCSAGELAGVLLLPVSTPALPRHVGARHTVTQVSRRHHSVTAECDSLESDSVTVQSVTAECDSRVTAV